MDSRLEKLQQALSESLAGALSEELSWHPPGKWCATEVLEHLYLTYTGTTKGFGRVAAAGRSLATSKTSAQRLGTLVVVVFGHMPQGRKAPAVAQPRGLPPEKVRAEIIAAIGEMDEIITRCEASFGRKAKLLDHPILGPLTAGQWRKFHLVHGLHHVKQILKLRQTPAKS
jgi:Protein of unknown function (DUF1569)